MVKIQVVRHVSTKCSESKQNHCFLNTLLPSKSQPEVPFPTNQLQGTRMHLPPARHASDCLRPQVIMPAPQGDRNSWPWWMDVVVWKQKLIAEEKKKEIYFAWKCSLSTLPNNCFYHLAPTLRSRNQYLKLSKAACFLGGLFFPCFCRIIRKSSGQFSERIRGHLGQRLGLHHVFPKIPTKHTKLMCRQTLYALNGTYTTKQTSLNISR